MYNQKVFFSYYHKDQGYKILLFGNTRCNIEQIFINLNLPYNESGLKLLSSLFTVGQNINSFVP